MTQTECVAYFMRRHEAYQFAHEFIVKLRFACPRVYGSGLYDIPVVEQQHYIVIPVDMCFQNFTAAGIVYVRTACVRNVGRLIDDSRVAGVFQTPGRIVRGGFLTDNGILESGFFEGFLPVVDTLNQVGNPLLRSSRVDVNNDRFLGFYKFSSQISFFVLVFRFETPTGDVRFVFHTVRVTVKVFIADSKIAYAGVIESRFHRLFGQEQHRAVQFVSHRTGGVVVLSNHFLKSAAHRRFPLEGAHGADFDILREGFQGVDIAGVGDH